MWAFILPATSSPAPQITTTTAGWAYRQWGIDRDEVYRQQDGCIDGRACTRFTESTTGQHDTHALPWFPPFTPSTRVFFSCSIDDDNRAACNLQAALFVLVLRYPPVVGGILPLWHQ